MRSSVLLTGDAGGLNYIKGSAPGGSKSSSFGNMSFCCSCASTDKQEETNLVPMRRQKSKSIKIKLKPAFEWNADTIQRYSNVESMRNPQYRREHNL